GGEGVYAWGRCGWVKGLPAGREGLDDDHAPAAARTGAGQYASVIGGHLVLIGLLHVWGNIQELTRPVDVLGPVAVGKQAIMADAVETFWQDVHEEAANELVGMERHRLPAIGAIKPIVLPAEGDATIVGGDEAPVGDGDAMRYWDLDLSSGTGSPPQ